jgi:2,4-dienoyl-CoA reductase-like NADH-dependent reductase (Old Yellow Enzyme family)
VTDVSPLFTPITINGCTLANRIVMAPMTRAFAVDGILAESGIDYYRRRAEGGTGLILTEGVAVSEIAAYNSSIPTFSPGPALERWRQTVEAVHDAGGRIMAQLWHTGHGRIREQAADPTKPSIGPMATYLAEGSPLIEQGGNYGEGHAMTTGDIDAAIAEFAEAASHALDAGFDGVELHGAHGYLIDQFLWSESNRRDDGYGGDTSARARFASEVIAAIRASTGPHFPIGLRFSQWKLPLHYGVKSWKDPLALERFLDPLVAAGLDFLDASTRRYWEPEFEGSELTLAGWAKQITGLPVIAVGSIGLDGPFDAAGVQTHSAPSNDLARIVDMVARGEVDMVGVGRALLSNPDWANRIRSGDTADLKPYDQAALAVHW